MDCLPVERQTFLIMALIRLGASALMQGLQMDILLLLRQLLTILAKGKFEEITHDHPEVISTVESVKNRIDSLNECS